MKEMIFGGPQLLKSWQPQVKNVAKYIANMGLQ